MPGPPQAAPSPIAPARGELPDLPVRAGRRIRPAPTCGDAAAAVIWARQPRKPALPERSHSYGARRGAVARGTSDRGRTWRGQVLGGAGRPAVAPPARMTTGPQRGSEMWDVDAAVCPYQEMQIRLFINSFPNNFHRLMTKFIS
jgi:hypothetical protein